MSEEINISCPECDVSFCVPIEFCGETAECDACGKLFKIKDPRNEIVENLKNTDTGSVADDPIDIDTTNTLKLSRSGIGMMPDVNDGFQLGAPQVEDSTRTKPAATHKTRNSPEKTIECPEWVQINIKEKEKIIGLREEINYLWKTPLMICISVISGIILAHFTNILIVTIIALIVSAIVFAIARKSQKALIVTNDRSILIIDKKTIEVKNSL